VELTPEGEPPQQEMALGLRYMQAIEAAGAIPVVVPPLSRANVEDLLSQVDGLCLSGGPDLDPASYGHHRDAQTGPSERHLDDFELRLARAADAQQLPILAICRGMQVLNVSRGGTLHQHLPDVVGTDIGHRQQAAGARATHWVTLEPSGSIARIAQRRRMKVNSFHHQAVDELGSGLIATSRAMDGTIESIEALDRDFVIGVQWHAECLAQRPCQAALFRAFVDAAREVGSQASLVRVA
jgi:putative glutamine amidotransferase